MSNIFSFYNQRYSQQSIDCCKPPPTNVKHLEPTNPWEFFANSWICFTKRSCQNFGFYPVSIACLQSKIYRQPLRSKQPNQQIHFRFAQNGCLFMWGAYFWMGAYKCDVVVVIKMSALYSRGAYFVWVLIIPILR